MPRTRGVGGAGAGVRRRIRRTVSPLRGIRRRVAIRAPASPPASPPSTRTVSVQPHRALGMGRGERREAFRKGPACTRRGETAKAADLQAEAHGLLDDGEVTQSAGRAAMDAGRRGMTIRAGGLGRTGTGVNEECGVGCGDVFHHKTRQGKGQQRRQHTIGIPHTKKISSVYPSNIRGWR